MRLARRVFTSVAIATAVVSTSVMAQSHDTADLMALNNSALNAELERRYQDGHAATSESSIIAVNDSRYLWALETKVQCGIALGFMKSSHRDPTSIAQCNKAHAQMAKMPSPLARAAVPPPTPAPRRAEFCEDAKLTTVFFDFDSSELKSDSFGTLEVVAQQARDCGWVSLLVVGHTDQAGSDQYNLVLSRRRADAVADALRGKIAPGTRLEVDAKGESNPRVPLADGTRSPENRRVEISAK